MSKVFLFNPYTGTPRHPDDIKSDPQGLLIVEPDAPLRAASPQPVAPEGEALLRSLLRECADKLEAKERERGLPKRERYLGNSAAHILDLVARARAALAAPPPSPQAAEPVATAEDKRDAERYRWLRDHHAQSFGATIDTPAEHTLVFLWSQGSPAEASWSLDDAIDAALRGEAGRS